MAADCSQWVMIHAAATNARSNTTERVTTGDPDPPLLLSLAAHEP